MRAYQLSVFRSFWVKNGLTLLPIFALQIVSYMPNYGAFRQTGTDIVLFVCAMSCAYAVVFFLCGVGRMESRVLRGAYHADKDFLRYSSIALMATTLLVCFEDFYLGFDAEVDLSIKLTGMIYILGILAALIVAYSIAVYKILPFIAERRKLTASMIHDLSHKTDI